MWNLVSICLFEVIFEFPVRVTVTSKLKAIKMVLISAQWEFLEDSPFTWLARGVNCPSWHLTGFSQEPSISGSFIALQSTYVPAVPPQERSLLLSAGKMTLWLFQCTETYKNLNGNGKTRYIKESKEGCSEKVTNKRRAWRGVGRCLRST